MKKIVRINITNHCNLSCSFCCVYGSPKNRSFLEFEKFKEIVDTYKNYALEVKLEGGEPLLHPRLFLFIEYLATLKNLKKIIIQTNGIILEEHADHIMNDAIRLNIPIEVKIAINDVVLEQNKSHMLMCKAMFLRSQRIPNLRVSFAVRYLSDDDLEYLLGLIDEYSIPRIYCDIDIFKSYGRLSDSEYPEIIDPDGAADWVCYTSDGTFFGTDLVARSEHEKLIIENQVTQQPVFDLVNHRRMWYESIRHLSEITFENKDIVKVWVFDFQKEYIRKNLNSYTEDMLHDKIYNYAKYYATRFHDSDYCRHDPFIYDIRADCCAENLVKEFYSNEHAMQKTTDMMRFYENKSLALDVANKIMNLCTKNNIMKTIDDSECCCRC